MSQINKYQVRKITKKVELIEVMADSREEAKQIVEDGGYVKNEIVDIQDKITVTTVKIISRKTSWT